MEGDMGDQEIKGEPAPSLVILPIETGHPAWNIPTIFFDSIANMAPVYGTVRFYVYRTDPEMNGKYPYKNQIFAQVIMPNAGFVQAAAFFERALKGFVAQKHITKEMVNAARTAEGLHPWSDEQF
jgi:hypothetical protein